MVFSPIHAAYSEQFQKITIAYIFYVKREIRLTPSREIGINSIVLRLKFSKGVLQLKLKGQTFRASTSSDKIVLVDLFKNLSIFRKWTILSESTSKPTGNCFE